RGRDRPRGHGRGGRADQPPAGPGGVRPGPVHVGGELGRAGTAAEAAGGFRPAGGREGEGEDGTARRGYPEHHGDHRGDGAAGGADRHGGGRANGVVRRHHRRPDRVRVGGGPEVEGEGWKTVNGAPTQR